MNPKINAEEDRNEYKKRIQEKYRKNTRIIPWQLLNMSTLFQLLCTGLPTRILPAAASVFFLVLLLFLCVYCCMFNIDMLVFNWALFEGKENASRQYLSNMSAAEVPICDFSGRLRFRTCHGSGSVIGHARWNACPGTVRPRCIRKSETAAVQLRRAEKKSV